MLTNWQCMALRLNDNTIYLNKMGNNNVLDGEEQRRMYVLIFSLNDFELLLLPVRWFQLQRKGEKR